MIRRMIIILILGFVLTGLVFAGDTDILVIQSYHAENSWDASYKEGLIDILADDYDITFFEMDTKRIPANQFQSSANAAYDKYNEMKPALVVLGDDNALKLLGPRFAETDSPVVYLGINNNPRAYGITRAPNITGVMERPLLKRTLLTIKEITSVSRILVLFDDGTTSQVTLDEVFEGRRNSTIRGIEIDIQLIGNWDEWQSTVQSAEDEGYDAIIIGLYHTIEDSAGNHIAASSVIEWTSKNTTIPPFGFWDFSIGADKAIGGLVLYGRSQGRQAGEMARQILEGASPSSIKPAIGEQGLYTFSKSELSRWNMSLPSDITNQATIVE